MLPAVAAKMGGHKRRVVSHFWHKGDGYVTQNKMCESGEDEEEAEEEGENRPRVPIREGVYRVINS